MDVVKWFIRAKSDIVAQSTINYKLLKQSEIMTVNL